MKTKNITTTIALAAIAIGGFILYQNQSKPENNTAELVAQPVESVATSTAASSSETAPINDSGYSAFADIDVNNIQLDYDNLKGKDRLYTEEEGKFENLSEAEKELMLVALYNPKCQVWCDWGIQHSHILSLKNDVLLLAAPTGKGGRIYIVYNVRSHKRDEEIWDSNTQIYSSSILVVISDKDSYDVREKLFYYRPGMMKFLAIPNSEIPTDKSYAKPVGLGITESEFAFDADTLEITIFERVLNADEQPDHIRTATFDLSTLP